MRVRYARRSLRIGGVGDLFLWAEIVRRLERYLCGSCFGSGDFISLTMYSDKRPLNHLSMKVARSHVADPSQLLVNMGYFKGVFVHGAYGKYGWHFVLSEMMSLKRTTTR
jgi:hypothetical protein